MNQTFTINLNGLVYHIDDNAYRKLDDYLKELERKFSGDSEKEEILRDIEARISEIFQTRISEAKKVISLIDVDAMIGLLGQPNDFEDAGEEPEAKSYQSSQKRYRRIYRDPDHRVLGGVASGLGSYFGVDPVVIRIIFLIAFFGFGAGLIIYLILWLVMPEAITTAQKLEMRGEAVTIDSISDFIKDEFNYVKEKVKYRKK